MPITSHERAIRMLGLRRRLKMYWALHRHMELQLIDLNKKNSKDPFQGAVEDLKRNKLKEEIMALLDHITELQKYITYRR